MDEKTLRVLEYNKILNMLAEYSASNIVKEQVLRLRPSSNIREIGYRQKETDEALRLLLKFGNPQSLKIDNQEQSVKKAAAGGVLAIPELLKIGDTLKIVRLMKDYGEGLEAFPVIGGYIEALIPSKYLEGEIERCIISEEEIADNATNELLQIRRNIKNLNNKVRDILNGLVTKAEYSKYLQENIVTMRGGRYVIPVKAEHKASVPGLIHDSSATGATVFIEPLSVVEANNKLRQEELKEKQEIDKILGMLSQSVSDESEKLLVDISHILTLDFAFAKGNFALSMDAVMPDINADGRIDLKKARHPLIEKHQVVPIDIKLGIDFDTLVITGPNTGGKTVTLKTAGLLCLMMQAGLHIPASYESSLSVFENIFADIGDEQSIEQSLSTFSSHMANIVKIIEKSSIGSLALFDELGAGTDPVEGAALAMSVLESMTKKGVKVIATTHYSELKMYAVSTNRVENASCEFDIETLRPTYRLITGIPGKSNAFAISEKLGLPKQIIDMAGSFLSSENIKFEDILLDLEKNQKMAEAERENAQRFKNEAESLREQLKKEKQRMFKEKQKIVEEANLKAIEIIENTQREMDETMKTIRQLQMEKKQKETQKAIQQVKEELKAKTGAMKNKFSAAKRTEEIKMPMDLRPGTEVYIIDMNQNGTVLSNTDKNGKVMVQAGILKLSLPLSGIKLAEDKETQKTVHSFVRSKMDNLKSGTISSQIDLRGKYADEAISLVDNFLNDAMIASLSTVTIVHGKGTGVLRNEVQKFLKTHPAVKSFRLGNYGEGENGVTIVEL